MEVDPAIPKERPPPKKRRRIVVSCTECHRRKQKCDRELPCANCKTRCREFACAYENGAPTAARAQVKRDEYSEPKTHTPPQSTEAPLSTMAASLGYSQTGTTTMGFLKKIESAGANDQPHHTPHTSQQDSLALKEKYKGLIRQLPAKVYLDELIAIFFKDHNWQYAGIDEEIFKKQYREWFDTPFTVLSTKGPEGLSPELRTFPAVLFQIIAISLLSLLEGPHSMFDTLKYAGDMTFEDLAKDYSESGTNIANLFAKKHLTVTTVEAQFLRSCFLKSTNNVTESWHVIGTAIRDAQELGLHRDSLDPKPLNQSIKEVLRNQWVVQRRRKLYLILVLWDINMSLVLGRPGCINERHGFPTLPVDTVVPSDTFNMPVIPRDEDKDPPTPLTKLLWWAKLAEPLRDIQALEQEGSYPKDFRRVDMIHHKILALEDKRPGCLRDVNPDTRWDHLPELWWLPEARKYMTQLHQFSLMALHRPYMFHREQSRTEALKASLEMLELQGKAFEGLSPNKWRDFMLFFGSFDAIVTITAIYMVYPREHPEYLSSALRNFHATVQRFSVMQDRNPLARSAQGVIKAIHATFTKAVGGAPTPQMHKHDDYTGADSASAPSGRDSRESGYESASGSRAGTTADAAAQLPPVTPASQWLPALDDLTGLATLYPTSDLIYNDLTALQSNEYMTSVDDPNSGPQMGDLSWQFGGLFGEDTVWQLLNQYQAGTPG
ncbi:hypothetical protein B0I35DRAFT_209418 [Stachybotrys elegans]|uniref:Zn(2)-C6 fungal-type domain-containing protein n=1 Tax=Stachybotrys elegans TaxID=80388 RepID=A0A8K0SUJ6_9HYPO|nr:hypothetical protein B0I35DRAFT_209418 [Stachybotrys elegans]